MALKVAGNITVRYGGTDITAYLNSSSVAATVGNLDVTNLASTGTRHIPGLPTYTFPFSGQWGKIADTLLAVDAISPPTTLRDLIITIGAAGATVVLTWTANAFVSDYTIDGSGPNDVLTMSGTIACSGIPVRTTP